MGLIIERLTGDSLPQQIRKRILEPLKMKNTYFEYYEPAHGNQKRIDAYLDWMNMTRHINTSYEWAGGGLVSTTKDTAKLIQALFELKLFDNEQTLLKMMDNSENKADGSTYGLGIYEYTFNGNTFYGHGGFYGSLLIHNPEKQITLSINIGQANPPFDTTKSIETVLDILTNSK